MTDDHNQPTEAPRERIRQHQAAIACSEKELSTAIRNGDVARAKKTVITLATLEGLLKEAEYELRTTQVGNGDPADQ